MGRPKAEKPAGEKFHPVKIHSSAFQRLNRLTLLVAQRGWVAAGLTRDDAPLKANVMDAALVVLEQRLKER